MLRKAIHVSGTTRSKLTDDAQSRLRGANVVEYTTLVIAKEGKEREQKTHLDVPVERERAEHDKRESERDRKSCASPSRALFQPFSTPSAYSHEVPDAHSCGR